MRPVIVALLAVVLVASIVLLGVGIGAMNYDRADTATIDDLLRSAERQTSSETSACCLNVGSTCHSNDGSVFWIELDDDGDDDDDDKE